MKTKAKRHLYECDDCHQWQRLFRSEFNRAARPHCNDCGCTRLTYIPEKDVKRRAEERQRLHPRPTDKQTVAVTPSPSRI